MPYYSDTFAKQRDVGRFLTQFVARFWWGLSHDGVGEPSLHKCGKAKKPAKSRSSTRCNGSSLF
jgi:hypothetical protein